MIVGGGPTGVEVAGALAEMIKTTIAVEYHDLPPDAAKVHVVNHGHELLAMFADKAHTYTAKVLTDDGVDLLLGTGVTEVGPGHVTLSDGSMIKTHCLVWGGGLKAAPIAGSSGLTPGKGGRIDVGPDMSVEGFPGVYVVGDIANIPDTKQEGKTHPQLGSVAMQSGAQAGKNIRAAIDGKPGKPFHYLDKGTMAMIGRGAAIASVHGVGAPREARLRGLARRSRRPDVRRPEPRRCVRCVGRRLLRQDARGAVARSQRGGPDRLGRGRLGGRRGSHAGWRSIARGLGMSGTDYDVIIIGSGAGGGTLAGHLAPSGKRILIVERGDWLPREIENWDADEVFVKNRYVSKETWYDEKGKAFQPGIHYYVGGQTKFYGAALYRLRKEDFGELRHHDGISPAWPISYDEMEPYYTKAEELYEVHGNHAEDPTEPRASRAYPFPAVTHEPRIQQLSDDLERAGYHPFHAPCGIRLLEGDKPNSVCIRCRDLRRLPVAGPGQSPMPRSSGSGRRSSTPT